MVSTLAAPLACTVTVATSPFTRAIVQPLLAEPVAVAVNKRLLLAPEIGSWAVAATASDPPAILSEMTVTNTPEPSV